MPETFLQPWARALVILHTMAAVVLVGSSTHHLLITIGYFRRNYRVRLGRIYAATVAVAYAATITLGALAYPTYRYYVRGLYLDRYENWASNLFDMKENFASLALPLALGAFAISRVMDPRQDRPLLLGYAVMVLGTTALVWTNTISGLLVTLVKGL